MQHMRGAFTLVELIVVITILVILSTIGFVSYSKYIVESRDANKLVRIGKVSDILTLQLTKGKLPLPDDYISVYIEDNLYAYQGDVGPGVMESIGYRGQNDQTDITYMLAADKKHFQLMVLLEDKAYLLSPLISSNVYAENQRGEYPKLIGDKLGILLSESTSTPIHKVASIAQTKEIDIANPPVPTVAYVDQNETLSSTNSDLTGIISNKNCRRILELGNSIGSGVYTISPDGKSKISVYCDMETQGGGWTFIAHLNGNSLGSEISFKENKGEYSLERASNAAGYSIKADNLSHTEMMLTIGTPDPQEANNAGKMLMLRYPKGLPGTYEGPYDCTGGSFRGSGTFEYKTYFENAYKVTPYGVCRPDIKQWQVRPNPLNDPITVDSTNKELVLITDDVNVGGYPKGPRYQPTAWGVNSPKVWGNSVWFYVR